MSIICETEVWCYKTEDKLGLVQDESENSIWLPFVFDWVDVVAVKLDSGNEFLGYNEKAVVKLYGDSMTINMPFEEAVEHFKQSRLKYDLEKAKITL